jgi:hypothetical protein
VLLTLPLILPKKIKGKIQMRFLLLAVLCLFTTPVKAAIYSIPDNGSVAVYGDFASAGGSILASFSYTETGGSFSHFYAYYDPATLEEINIRINVNTLGSAVTYACNQTEARCGRSNKVTPYFAIYGPVDEGFMSIYSSAWTTGGAVAPELELFVNLPEGFSLTAPVAAVPETSTWIMMLLGFAGIGLLMVKRDNRQPLLQ